MATQIPIFHPRTGEQIGWRLQSDPAPGWKSYDWADFLERLHDSGKARQVRALMGGSDDLARDLAQFFDLARARGRVDFNFAFNRAVFADLVAAAVISQAAADNFMGAA